MIAQSAIKLLEADEIGDSAKENSICCDTCGTWWHLPCADLSMSTADALDSWVCQSCLVDAATAIIIDSDDDLEFNSSRIRSNGYKHSQHSV